MRKSPCKHIVKSHLRKGKRVFPFWRGRGLPRKAPLRQRTLIQYQNPNRVRTSDISPGGKSPRFRKDMIYAFRCKLCGKDVTRSIGQMPYWYTAIEHFMLLHPKEYQELSEKGKTGYQIVRKLSDIVSLGVT